MRAIDGDALYQEFEAMAWYDNADRDLAEDMLLRVPTLTPPNETRIINADKLAKRIAGHSNYHGDSILSAIYCAAEGKENNAPIRPIENPPNEWVSVEERLPDDNERVIAYRPKEADVSAYKYCVMWGWSVKMSMKRRGISHWMPLPEPPEYRPPEGEEDT